jgi:hypothetical protein
MASLVEMAGSSLYGGYTQGTFGVNPSPDFQTLIGYSNPAHPDQVDNPQGSGIWGVGNKNFAFGNVKARSFYNKKSLHNAGAAAVSNYGPNNTSPGIGTGIYMDPFASGYMQYGSGINAVDLLAANQPYATSPQAPGSYEHGVQSPPF